MVRALLLVLIAAWTLTPKLAQELVLGTTPTADDAAIYKAVLAHTIRPAAIRAAKAAGNIGLATHAGYRPHCRDRLGRSAATASAWVHERRVHRAVRAFFRSGTGFRPGTEMVRPLVSPSARQQLAESFGMRNSENYPIPELKIDDIVLFNVEELDESIKRAPRQWRSYSRFSRPAYSSEDQALVYATFQTSQGQGWFFLLERRAGEWHVQSVAPVWMG